MNLENFLWLDRLKLALAVLQDWRFIVTLVFLIVIIAVVRELSTFYKKKKPKRPILTIPKPKPKKTKPAPSEEKHEEAEAEDMHDNEKRRR